MKWKNLLYFWPIAVLLLSCSRGNLPPSGSGLIEATEVTFSSQAMGQLQKLNFDEGNRIVTGDTIGVIDTATTILQIQEAKAALEAAKTRVLTTGIAIEQADYNLGLAKKDFDRISSLLKTGSANQQQFDQSENAYNQALLAKKQAAAAYSSAQSDVSRSESALALLNKQLHDSYPISPVTGTVVNKYVEVGELIVIGKQILKIAKLDTVWVKVYLPPSDLTRIKLGGPAKVDPESGQKRVDGTISWISDVAEFTPKNVQTKEARADLVYAVKVIIPNSEGVLKIGMPVSVVLE